MTQRAARRPVLGSPATGKGGAGAGSCREPDVTTWRAGQVTLDETLLIRGLQC